VRLYLFSIHYRNDVDYKEEDILSKKKFLEKIHHVKNKKSDKTSPDISNFLNDFFNHLDDDLNSPKALEIFEKICDLALKDGSISKEDLDKITSILGLSL
jgi:cysteinyl-tRNA synthetase